MIGKIEKNKEKEKKNGGIYKFFFLKSKKIWEKRKKWKQKKERNVKKNIQRKRKEGKENMEENIKKDEK